MIPEAAMDAALIGFSNEIAKVGALHKDALRAALEAAAPHMLAGAWRGGYASGLHNMEFNGVPSPNPYRTANTHDDTQGEK